MEEESTVFIVDDEEPVTKALANAVQLMGLPSQTYSSAEAFLKSYDTTRPGCLVLDYKLPGKDGLELQEHLTAIGNLLPVIMISAHANVKVVVKAMKGGSVTFLEKPFSLHVLRQEIAGAIELDAARRLEAAECRAAKAKIAALTGKEREVLRLVAAGNTNQAIANMLRLSIRAVEDRRGRMMKKLGAKGLSDVIAICRKASMRLGGRGGQDRRR
ncbi:MAG: response regulator transcription factor [Pirellulaceae bacterium]|nr:response regulator transcription factor [Pirellulaceae bacterium]